MRCRKCLRKVMPVAAGQGRRNIPVRGAKYIPEIPVRCGKRCRPPLLAQSLLVSRQISEYFTVCVESLLSQATHFWIFTSLECYVVLGGRHSWMSGIARSRRGLRETEYWRHYVTPASTYHSAWRDTPWDLNFQQQFCRTSHLGWFLS